MFAIKAFGAFVQASGMVDTVGPVVAQHFLDNALWPPVWLYMSPSLHEGDAFLGFPQDQLGGGLLTIGRESIVVY